MLDDQLRAGVDDQRPQAPLSRHGERIERVPDLVFDDDRQVAAFVERLLEQVEGKRLDRITPSRRGAPARRLAPDGGDPARLLERFTICTIRRFRLAAGTLDELVTLAFLSEQAADFLAACVRARQEHRRLRARLIRARRRS